MAFPNRLPPPPRANNPLSHINMIKNNYLKQLESAPPSSEPSVSEPPMFEAVPNEVPAVGVPPAVESSSATEPFDIFAFVSPELMAPDLSFDSPGETPALDFLSTPIDALPWESPALIDCDNYPLFHEVQSLLFGTTLEDKAPATFATDPAFLMHSSPMYTIPSTPALAPASLFPSPHTPSSKLPGNAPTGHRKGMSVAQMVPLDAPTQTRNYYTESKTSRKVVPAGFVNKVKKRTREDAGFAVDDVDEIELTPDLEDAIEAKRRQNTLAARKSRARKAETARQHEELISALTDENTRLREENDALRLENNTLKRLGH